MTYTFSVLSGAILDMRVLRVKQTLNIHVYTYWTVSDG